MECSFVKNQLFSYQENDLSAEDRRKFEDHIRSCQDCSGIVSEFISVTSVIDKQKIAEPNPFIRTRIMQRIESMLGQEYVISPPEFSWVVQPVILSFIFLVAVIIGFSLGKHTDIKYSMTINHQQDIQTMKSELNIPDFIDENNTLFVNK
jgi:hypothetical protein